ncbi:MAG: hypothetical protein ABIQ05_05200 [Candidatus Limnocylindria bacterium]
MGHVALEHIAYHLHRNRVGLQAGTVAAAPIAMRVAAHRPLAATGLALHAGPDAFDDAGPLELGEDPQHLEHHASRWGGGVERLRQGAEGNPRCLEFLDQRSQLAEVAR